ncbi:MAG: flagellar assembly peptidoglycan hydrolase FlgJ [Thiomonas arsenitoxydans]|uniref:Peptidoglycan hydrolase FlgJ n=1 Tax=Thiomonas arsenitoxydans (strain DSM 22701 / CIP 110005 / 3As) TaxID=426114 RepID=A0A8I1SX05_THIA3|nr:MULTISPECIES: flagellar assembly peptidoglycan hydrolase FlgJ [Thiomonas]MBN8745223.1 flagellar assembly peptidoglycan hydrolase FlgJ [Thiomonas arsenitoxydans]ODU96333.1 MAG: flagellar rod assembly protein/muramidase FlgJ [Thiomonas sp. SCN 64-16]
MTTPPSPPLSPLPPSGAAASNSLSFQGLNQLKAAANADPRSPQAIKAVAQQFEALLMQQMLSAMNATSLGPDLLGDTAGPMFKSMFTQQLATTLSQGQGMGLATYIARELSTRYGLNPGLDPASSKQPSVTPAAPADGGSIAANAVNTQATALPLASAAAALPVQSLATYRQNALPVQPLNPTPGTSPTAPSSPAKSATSPLEQAKSFIASILPSVQTAAKQLGVAPVAILAQAALETGWGQHAPGNNVFGVKAGSGWAGGTVQTLTREFQNGVASVGTAAFRAYQNVADSVDNYAALLSRPRYQSARGQGNDISAFASALQRSGYATDPDYAAKLVAIARSPRMQLALQQLGVDSGPDSSSAAQ